MAVFKRSKYLKLLRNRAGPDLDTMGTVIYSYLEVQQICLFLMPTKFFF